MFHARDAPFLVVGPNSGPFYMQINLAVEVESCFGRLILFVGPNAVLVYSISPSVVPHRGS